MTSFLTLVCRSVLCIMAMAMIQSRFGGLVCINSGYTYSFMKYPIVGLNWVLLWNITRFKLCSIVKYQTVYVQVYLVPIWNIQLSVQTGFCYEISNSVSVQPRFHYEISNCVSVQTGLYHEILICLFKSTGFRYDISNCLFEDTLSVMKYPYVCSRILGSVMKYPTVCSNWIMLWNIQLSVQGYWVPIWNIKLSIRCHGSQNYEWMQVQVIKEII